MSAPNTNSSVAIRLRDALLTRTQFFPPAHGNSAYLRIAVTQDGSEHIIILPFDEPGIAESFNTKLLDLIGEPLEKVGALESSSDN